ncbi:MAG: hypothetical protein JNG90_05010 [Planctomycetaceae bacterium]|nr:hypothetical protein [Planctomycetaceae bacterium]
MSGSRVLGEWFLLVAVAAPLAAVGAAAQAAETTTAPPTSGDQVLVDFQVIDVDRAALRKAGMEFDAKAFETPLPADSVLPRLLELLITQKVAKTVASPNICAAMGRPAHFHSGGEFPIRIVQEDGKETVEHKRYGTEVDFTPTLADDGKLHLNLKLRISNVIADQTGQVAAIPKLEAFDLSSAFAVGENETRVFAGPMQIKQWDGDSGREVTRLVLVKATRLTEAELSAMRTARPRVAGKYDAQPAK